MIRKQDIAIKEFKLKGWLRTKMPQAENLRITRFDRTSSGFSNETYFLTVRWREAGEEKEEKLVVRWPPEAFPHFRTYDLTIQFRLMKALETSSVPVPKMWWYEGDPKVLGVPFYVMGVIEGELPPDKAPGYHASGLLFEANETERCKLWQRMIEVIARIHQLDWEGLGLSFLRGYGVTGKDVLMQEIAFYEDLLDFSGIKLPLFQKAFDWVKKNAFEPSSVCLCWGDARPGNLVYREGKVVGVLDWESARIGLPEGDLAWLCVSDELARQNYNVPRPKGLPDMQGTYEYYQSITGRKLENLMYHEVFATLRAAVNYGQAGKNVEAAGGMEGFPPGFSTNNTATQRLAKLLKI